MLNIPMKLIEEKLLVRRKNKAAKKWKRPLSMVLSLALILLVLAVVIGMVLPPDSAHCRGSREESSRFYGADGTDV